MVSRSVYDSGMAPSTYTTTDGEVLIVINAAHLELLQRTDAGDFGAGGIDLTPQGRMHRLLYVLWSLRISVDPAHGLERFLDEAANAVGAALLLPSDPATHDHDLDTTAWSEEFFPQVSPEHRELFATLAVDPVQSPYEWPGYDPRDDVYDILLRHARTIHPADDYDRFLRTALPDVIAMIPDEPTQLPSTWPEVRKPRRDPN